MSIPNTCHQFSLLLMIVLKYLTCVLTITEGSKNCALWNTTQIKVKKKKIRLLFPLICLCPKSTTENPNRFDINLFGFSVMLCLMSNILVR